MALQGDYKARQSPMKSQRPPKSNPMRRTKKQKLNSKQNYALDVFCLPKRIIDVWVKTTWSTTNNQVWAIMLDAYLEARKTRNLLILGVDGTSTEYSESDCDYKKQKSRPYLQAFLKQVARYYDIVIFTANKHTYAQNMWRLHFRKYSPLFFWNDHLHKGLKDVSCLMAHVDILRIVDAEKNLVPGKLKDFLIPIQIWKGTKPDHALAPIGTQLVKLAHGEQKHQQHTKNSLGIDQVDSDE